MLKTTTGSKGNTWRAAGRRLTVAAALVLGAVGIPLTTQAATLALPNAGDRYCTAGSNSQYGWFFHDPTSILNCASPLSDCKFGVWVVPNLGSSCVTATPANLRVRLGTSDLPLVGAAEYVLTANPPQLLLSLLEPALCEDYGDGNGGTTSWNLVVEDANGQNLLAPVKGVATLDYILTGADSGVMVANGNVSLRCYSGMASNALPPQTGPGGPSGDVVFIDNFEPPYIPPTGPNLQVQFLRTNEPILNDLLIQGSGAAAEVEFTVRVTNIGNALAEDVRVREFVPTSSLLLMPTATRLGCTHNSGTQCPNANGNSNGIGVNPLRFNIGNLAPGAFKDIVLRRHSNGSAANDQPLALIQVAAFTSSNELDHTDNSRSLRIQVVNQLQLTYVASTDGVQGNTNGGTLSVTNTPAGCTASGSTVTCPPGTTGLELTAAVTGTNGNYSFNGFTGCTGNISGTSFTSTASTVSCTLVADFRTKPTVTASVSGGHGTVTPSSQVVNYGAQADVTITPDLGYAVDTVTGCGATQVGATTTWRTTPRVAPTPNCAITAKFKARTSTVTATAGPNGAITSAPSVTITYPTVLAVFTVVPNQSYNPVVAASTTCTTVNGPVPIGGGVLVYSADNVIGDCQIDFEFQLVTHPVTVANTNNGALVLDSPTVPHGQYAHFTVVPAAGYHLNGAVTGTSACGTIQVTGNTGTAGPIEAAGCELSAQFAINEYTVTVSLAPDAAQYMTIGPKNATAFGTGPVVITPVVHNTSAEVWVVVQAGHFPIFPIVPGCNFISVGTDPNTQAAMYRALQVTDNCSVEVGFGVSRPAGMSLKN